MEKTSYTDPEAMPDDERMTDAEMRVVREFLGVTPEWLAEHLAVSARTVRHWEAGKFAIPDGVRLSVEQLEGVADQQVAVAVELLNDAAGPVLGLPRHDSDCPPECPFPAGWHRAIAARVALEVPGLSMRYDVARLVLSPLSSIPSEEHR